MNQLRKSYITFGASLVRKSFLHCSRVYRLIHSSYVPAFGPTCRACGALGYFFICVL